MLQKLSKKRTEYISWVIIVEGNLKALFTITTTLRCKGGQYS